MAVTGFRIQHDDLKRLKKVARRLKKSPRTLIREWVVERIKEEENRVSSGSSALCQDCERSGEAPITA